MDMRMKMQNNTMKDQAERCISKRAGKKTENSKTLSNMVFSGVDLQAICFGS